MALSSVKNGKDLTIIKKDERTEASFSKQQILNIVVVGDGDIGKTSLLMTFQGKKLDPEYTPTVFETYTRNITVDDKDIEIGLWDLVTAGQDGYDRLRQLAYPTCDAIIICYAVDSPDSLFNVLAKWLPEVEYYCPNRPKILAATKKDLRRRTLAIMDILNSNQCAKFVSYEEGMCTAVRMGASKFIETSALSYDSVRELFEHTTRAALHWKSKEDFDKKPSKEKCCVL